MTTNLTREEAQVRSQLLSTHTYDVHLDITSAPDSAQTTFTSTSTVTFDAAAAAKTFIDFIAESVTAITVNDQPLDPATHFDGTRVTFPTRAGANTVTVTGQAVYSTSGEGMHRFIDPADNKVYLYTQFEPTDARRVFANFDQPDLKARFTFSVTAPADFVVLNNAAEVPATGPADPTGPTGPATHRFATTQRMSTYITCVCAGHYAGVHDTYSLGDLTIDLGLYVRASLAESMDAKDIFTVTKQGLDFYHENFDYPYPWGKYDQIFVPEYNLGAMENPGLVTFVDSYIYRDAVTRTEYESRANVILHEMAHMWFGDLVTMRWWDDLWLKESFADYMASLALTSATEYTDGWVTFALRRKDWAYRQDQYPTTHPIVADIPDIEAARLNFDGITYAKGAAVLKQLVAFVGLDAFMAGARDYFRAHEFSNTTLADFLTALESRARGRDVRGWADAWLTTTGVSEIALQVETGPEVPAGTAQPTGTAQLPGGTRPAGGTRVAITSAQVSQTNTGAQVTRPHTFHIAGFNRERRALTPVGTWQVDFAQACAPVPALVGQPRPDLLLVGHGDDDFAKVRLDAESTRVALACVTKLPAALDRAVVWSALSNAMRDGLLPVVDFLDAYARTLGREPHAGINAGLRTQALTALSRWVADADREAALAHVLGAALDALGAAQAGSDAQLSIAETVLALVRRSVRIAYPGPEVTAAREFASHLASHAAGATVAGLGLTVDNALKWKALVSLSVLGWADEGDIAAQSALDRTDSGEMQARTARAAQPLPIVKMRAFEAATTDTSLSNNSLSATIAGFAAPVATPILEPFVQRYFELLESFWTTRSNEMAKRLVLGLYPAWSFRAAHVAQLTDDWLTGHVGAPSALRRLVMELGDDMHRAVRVQGAQAGG